MSPLQFSTLAAFDHQPRTRLVFGAGCVERLGALAQEFAGRNVLLVTDPGLVAAGHADRVRALLERAGLCVTLFARVQENPTTRCVEDCVSVARAGAVETLVALGGGSSLDTAKGCNFILTNGGRMQDYWGVGRATQPMLPLIAVPTTAGTGSECQSAALIADEQTHQKMACLDPRAAPRIALLDPTLTVSQPRRVTACTGIDAVAHAVEAAVTKKRNAFSLMCAQEAFKLTAPNFPRVLHEPTDLEARGRMQLGAAFAGMAIEASMLGAAHAAANPLTAHYAMAHGQAVGLMLPHVVRFNGADPEALRAYRDLASAAEIAHAREGLQPALDGLVAHLDSLLALTEMPRSLQDCGVDREAIPTLAEEASRQWTAQFNPRPVRAEDFQNLYAAAFAAGPATSGDKGWVTAPHPGRG